MPDLDVRDDDCHVVREVYCFAPEHFSEADALQLAAESFRARHRDVSLCAAWDTISQIIEDGHALCACQSSDVNGKFVGDALCGTAKRQTCCHRRSLLNASGRVDGSPAPPKHQQE